MPLLILLGAILIISGAVFIVTMILKRYGAPNPFVTVFVTLGIGLAIAYWLNEFHWRDAAIVTAAVVSLPLFDSFIHVPSVS